MEGEVAEELPSISKKQVLAMVTESDLAIHVNKASTPAVTVAVEKA